MFHFGRCQEQLQHPADIDRPIQDERGRSFRTRNRHDTDPTDGVPESRRLFLRESLLNFVMHRRIHVFTEPHTFRQVSKWKLYKTARKRGIYAEIKKQNAAQQALTKVPTNVQHFADMGVYKQLKKKAAHAAAAAGAGKDMMFPHLPPPPPEAGPPPHPPPGLHHELPPGGGGGTSHPHPHHLHQAHPSHNGPAPASASADPRKVTATSDNNVFFILSQNSCLKRLQIFLPDLIRFMRVHCFSIHSRCLRHRPTTITTTARTTTTS